MRYSFGVSFVILYIFSTVVSAQPTPDYYPLKTGSEWTLTGYGTTPTITNTVSGTEIIDGIEYAKIEVCHSYNGEQKGVVYERCEDNCVYRLVPPQKEKLLFDFNKGISESWGGIVYLSDYPRKTLTGRIIGEKITVTVPAGEFTDCIVCEITEGSESENTVHYVIYTYWLAPDIGIVKMSVNIGGSIAPIDLWLNDLTSYNIPGD